ncbi:hypothetical protein IAR55_004806 [Kwoniella newhampshirensis]|uniref:SET domain-containing protein n=1 Tax=Kwoniella newhampshirensis TaxID=1651941 RepID=A0AAW0YU94_9TREE
MWKQYVVHEQGVTLYRHLLPPYDRPPDSSSCRPVDVWVKTRSQVSPSPLISARSQDSVISTPITTTTTSKNVNNRKIMTLAVSTPPTVIPARSIEQMRGRVDRLVEKERGRREQGASNEDFGQHPTPASTPMITSPTTPLSSNPFLSDESLHDPIIIQDDVDDAKSIEMDAATRPCPPTPPRSESPVPSSQHRLPYTSITRPKPVSSQYPFEFHSYAGKSFGLRATRRVRRGELIIKEAPFLTIPVEDVNETITIDHILPSLPSSTCRYREVLHSFACRKDAKAEKDYYVNLVETNSIPLRGEDGSSSLGMFEHICRVNHSCTPNSGWRWYEGEGYLHLYAYTDIPQGEEITVSYLPDVTLPRHERQTQLLNGLGFVCLCTACSSSVSDVYRSDTSLALYGCLRDQWVDTHIVNYAWDLDGALRKLNQAMDILRLNKKYDAMGGVLEQLFDVYAVHGMMEEARMAGRRALDHFSTCLGDVGGTGIYARLVEDPTEYEHWGVLKDEAMEQQQEQKRRRKRQDQESCSVTKLPRWDEDGPYMPGKD